MKTKNWDRILKNKVSEVNDEIALFWPDDTMFGDRLACFPIVSKRAMEIANDIWPMPFHTYKIDDELRDIFPLSRRFFIPEIIMKHHNDKGEVGYHLPDGRCYPNNLPVLHADDELFMGRQNLRTEIREKLQREIR
jgi:hypothetical protein